MELNAFMLLHTLQVRIIPAHTHTHPNPPNPKHNQTIPHAHTRSTPPTLPPTHDPPQKLPPTSDPQGLSLQQNPAHARRAPGHPLRRRVLRLHRQPLGPAPRPQRLVHARGHAGALGLDSLVCGCARALKGGGRWRVHVGGWVGVVVVCVRGWVVTALASQIKALRDPHSPHLRSFNQTRSPNSSRHHYHRQLEIVVWLKFWPLHFVVTKPPADIGYDFRFEYGTHYWAALLAGGTHSRLLDRAAAAGFFKSHSIPPHVPPHHQCTCTSHRTACPGW
jgi:hypothetical protein